MLLMDERRIQAFALAKRFGYIERAETRAHVRNGKEGCNVFGG